MRRRRSYRRSFSIETARRGGRLLFALYFIAVVLLVLSRLDNSAIRAAHDAFTQQATPVLEAVSVPVAYFRRAMVRARTHMDGIAELDRLKAENARLRQWEWQAKQLERRVTHLRSLLNGVDEPALKYVTARVIADARGPFARSVLLNVGKDHGVKPGYAVINGEGLVGRAVDVGKRAARIIMLNDLNSRIPVLVGPAGARAILVGDNGPEPGLEFLSDSDDVYEKDEVYTSGDGGLFPRGLRIGTVTLAGGKGLRTRPHVRFDRLEYVSVLFFDTPVILSGGTSGAGALMPDPASDRRRAEARR